MADKRVADLEVITDAANVKDTDLFILQQDSFAKTISTRAMQQWLLTIANTVGFITSIVKQSTNNLVDTYKISFSKDGSTPVTFTVTNGNGISGIAKQGTNGLVDTYKITFTKSGMSPFTFNVTNGSSIASIAKQGSNGLTDTYKVTLTNGNTTTFQVTNGNGISSIQQTTTSTQSSGDNIITATLLDGSTKTFTIKNGAKGDTGDASAITSHTIRYAPSTSGTTAPTSGWTSTIPIVTQGQYLWTRTVLNFNDNTTVTSYSVTRMGLNGEGAVGQVNGKDPDASGNVTLVPIDIGATGSVNGKLPDSTGNVLLLPDDIGAEGAKLKFINTAVPTSAFAPDTSYEDFPFKVTVPLTGVTADMIADVMLSVVDSTSGVFAPAVESYNGGIYLYASEVPTNSVTIPTILIWRA